MGRIVSNFFMSLDGVVEAPNEWHFPYFDEAMGQVVGSGMATTTAFLMGRKLYGEWSQFWPQQGPEVPFAETINGIDKYVVSSSLDRAEWTNTTVLRGDVAAVQAVKDATDGDIGMSGSATTVRWLLANGLLDELALLVHPIVVGHGQRLYEDPQAMGLTLTHQEALPSGVLHVRYVPAAT